ncbi:MAG: hypothetical protein KGP35_08580 [Bacteroidetes bacterium]|nr:hypothetical protein [Bacteroidota bacterium]
MLVGVVYYALQDKAEFLICNCKAGYRVVARWSSCRHLRWDKHFGSVILSESEGSHL